MPNQSKIAYTVAAGARAANVAEATFLARIERLKISPVLHLSCGGGLRPVYDEAAIAAVRAPFDRVRSLLRNAPEADILAAAPALDALATKEAARLSAEFDPTQNVRA